MDLRSGMPLQLIHSGLLYNYPRLNENIETQVLIVGGGITGALCNYFMTKAGLECVVVDARTIGLGSTCASSSLLQYELDVPLHKLGEMVGESNAVRAYKLCHDAIFKLKKITEEIGSDEFILKPSLQYASFKKDDKMLEKEYQVRKQHGFDVDLLDEPEIESMFPIVSSSGLLSKVAAETNSYVLAHQLHQYSKKKGSRIYDRTEIVEFTYPGRKVQARTFSGHTITARQVIYATGYESEKYLPEKVLNLHSTYAIASEQMDGFNGWHKNCLIWETARPYLYMRVTRDNRIVVGGKDEPFYDPELRDKLNRKKSEQLEETFHKTVSGISMIKEFSWCGTFGESKDGLPYIGTTSNRPHSYFAIGTGGNGITFSIVAAEIIRDKIIGKPNQDANIFKFSR